MKVNKVDHITINMSEVEKSFLFYEKLLGLKKIEEVDIGDHILHLYQLTDVKLELIEYKEEQKIIKNSNTDKGIYRHFAICVDNLEECKQLCEKGGYVISLYPQWMEEIHKTIMLIIDPNGVEIEIIQD